MLWELWRARWASVCFLQVPNPRESHGPLCAFGKFRTHSNHMGLCVLLASSEPTRITWASVCFWQVPNPRESHEPLYSFVGFRHRKNRMFICIH